MNTQNEDFDAIEALKASGFQERKIAGMPEGVTLLTGTQDPKPAEQGPADFWEGAEVISGYSRAQAIADGVLVDLTADGETKLLVREAGFKLPVAMTATAFHDTVLAGTTENESGEFIFPPGQSTKGRLWDVLMILRHTICTANNKGDTDRVEFHVHVDANGDGKHETVKLWAHIGPGDAAEPVLTIMLIGED